MSTYNYGCRNNGGKKNKNVATIIVLSFLCFIMIFIIGRCITTNSAETEYIYTPIEEIISEKLYVEEGSMERVLYEVPLKKSKENADNLVLKLANEIKNGNYVSIHEMLYIERIESYGYSLADGTYEKFDIYLDALREAIYDKDEIIIYESSKRNNIYNFCLYAVDRLDKADSSIDYDYDNRMTFYFTVYSVNGTYKAVPFLMGLIDGNYAELGLEKIEKSIDINEILIEESVENEKEESIGDES